MLKVLAYACLSAVAIKVFVLGERFQQVGFPLSILSHRLNVLPQSKEGGNGSPRSSNMMSINHVSKIRSGESLSRKSSFKSGVVHIYNLNISPSSRSDNDPSQDYDSDLSGSCLYYSSSVKPRQRRSPKHSFTLNSLDPFADPAVKKIQGSGAIGGGDS